MTEAVLSPRKLTMHMMVVISEYESYDDFESAARDANQGDAILRSWSTKVITVNDLATDEEREFFGVEEEVDDGS